MLRFKIDFEKAFSMMDSDRISNIGVKENNLCITHHKRARVVHFENGWYITEANDYTYVYHFSDRKALEKIYLQLTNTDEIDWDKFRREVRQYVPTRLGKNSSMVIKRGDKF